MSFFDNFKGYMPDSVSAGDRIVALQEETGESFWATVVWQNDEDIKVKVYDKDTDTRVINMTEWHVWLD